MKSHKIYLLFAVSLIYVLTGPPREGKTFYATYKALQILKKGKEKVFSNYPIIYRVPLTFHQKIRNLYNRILKQPLIQNKILSSIAWKREYMKDPIYDATIIIDEAYKDFNSRDWKSFTKQDHEWFATNGHNLIDIWIISQNSSRVDTVIREVGNYFIQMRKKYLFWNIGFLWFTAEYYLKEADMNLNRKGLDLTYTKDRLTMRSDVKVSYDTHYFRDARPEKTYPTWYDLLQVVPEEKFSVNWGKIIMAGMIIIGMSFFVGIMYKIFF